MRDHRRPLLLFLVLLLLLPMLSLGEDLLPYQQMRWPEGDPQLTPVPAPYGYRIVGRGGTKLHYQRRDGGNARYFYMMAGIAMPLAAAPDGSGTLAIQLPTEADSLFRGDEEAKASALLLFREDYTAWVEEKEVREPEPEELPAWALDTSCVELGYIHAAARGTEPLILQLECGGTLHHVRIPPDELWHPILLTLGRGEYTVRIYQAGLMDEFVALLQEEPLGMQLPPADTELALLDSAHCDLINNAELVAYAQSICQGTDDDWEKFTRIRNALYRNARYDNDYANTIKYTKIPEPEIFLKNGNRGICGDYSAYIAISCRAVGIPCKMVSGINPRTGNGHGWNEFYIDGEWWMTDVVVEKREEQKKYEPYHLAGSGYAIKKDYWAGFD